MVQNRFHLFKQELKAEEFNRIRKLTLGNAVVNGMTVSINGTNITVLAGACSVDGVLIEETVDLTNIISIAGLEKNPAAERTDYVVCTYNFQLIDNDPTPATYSVVQGDSLTGAPPTLADNQTKLGEITVQQGTGPISFPPPIKTAPVLVSAAAMAAHINDSTDDHLKHPLVDGTRGFTGVVSGIVPVLEAHLATKGYTDAALGGVAHQNPVLDKDLDDPPGGENVGDRYIVSGTGGTALNAWAGHELAIAEVDSITPTVWSFVAASQGMTAIVTDENVTYNFNGSAWVNIGSTVNHATLLNLTAGDPHTQYFLKTLLTGKGDLIAASAVGTPEVVPAGTDGQILVARPVETPGVKFENPAVAVPGLAQVEFYGDGSDGSFTVPERFLTCVLTETDNQDNIAADFGELLHGNSDTQGARVSSRPSNGDAFLVAATPDPVSGNYFFDHLLGNNIVVHHGFEAPGDKFANTSGADSQFDLPDPANGDLIYLKWDQIIKQYSGTWPAGSWSTVTLSSLITGFEDVIEVAIVHVGAGFHRGVGFALKRDAYFDNLTIPAGMALLTNGFRIFVKGTLTLNGIIANNAPHAEPRHTNMDYFPFRSRGYMGAPSGSLPGGSRGGTVETTNPLNDFNGKDLGRSMGGNGGSTTFLNERRGGKVRQRLSMPPIAKSALQQYTELTSPHNMGGGCGGCAGRAGSFGADGNGWGPGGGGGGSVLIAAKNLVIGAAGQVEAFGGMGAPGLWTSLNYQSGAGGGGGGAVRVLYDTITNARNMSIDSGRHFPADPEVLDGTLGHPFTMVSPPSALLGINDGQFRIVIDGVGYDITGLDFTLATGYGGVATAITTALSGATGIHTVTCAAVIETFPSTGSWPMPATGTAFWTLFRFTITSDTNIHDMYFESIFSANKAKTDLTKGFLNASSARSSWTASHTPPFPKREGADLGDAVMRVPFAAGGAQGGGGAFANPVWGHAGFNGNVDVWKRDVGGSDLFELQYASRNEGEEQVHAVTGTI